jgi:hypothetical protein
VSRKQSAGRRGKREKGEGRKITNNEYRISNNEGTPEPLNL